MKPSDLANDLKTLVAGNVLDKDWQRAIYATDASSYAITPLCVVIPRNREDVISVVKYEKKIPIAARGGGTGLVGQALSGGIVIDLSTNLSRINA